MPEMDSPTDSIGLLLRDDVVEKEIARRHDALKEWQNEAAAVMAQFISLSSRPDEQEWGKVALEATQLLNLRITS